MKKDFMEIFGEIDERYLMEAANTDCEEYGAEKIRPVNSKKRLFPSVVKYAACFALVGAAAFTAYKLGMGSTNPLPSTPLSSDEITEAAEESTDISQENIAAEITEFTEDPALESTDPADPEQQAKKEADLNEWRSRTLVNPVDCELPEYYSPYYGGESGWHSMLIYTDERAEVKAISYGEVAFAGYKEPDPLEGNGETGYCVVIKHNDHVYIEYGCLSPDILVKTGDTVEAGQPLGYAGDFGDMRYGFGMDVGGSNLLGDKFYNVRKNIIEEDRNDWLSRTLVSPIDGELPDNYSAMRTAAGRLSGWGSMVIPAPQGSEVRAISYGEVVFADYQEANIYHAHNEYIIVIKHNDHVYSAYSTLSPETTLQAGDTVEAGQRIGYVDYRLFDGDGEYGFVFYVGAVNFAEN